mmetsp:Transcript_24963/g.36634  ORF Transcript_24963/g.36634 Transcript_24963/m.36634 type:complete len:235 (+) Transcript_24963:197-901(+)
MNEKNFSILYRGSKWPLMIVEWRKRKKKAGRFYASRHGIIGAKVAEAVEVVGALIMMMRIPQKNRITVKMVRNIPVGIDTRGVDMPVSHRKHHVQKKYRTHHEENTALILKEIHGHLARHTHALLLRHWHRPHRLNVNFMNWTNMNHQNGIAAIENGMTEKLTLGARNARIVDSVNIRGRKLIYLKINFGHIAMSMKGTSIHYVRNHQLAIRSRLCQRDRNHLVMMKMWRIMVV